MADQWIKGEDGAASYGCTINWIRHHSPELIIKEGYSEVERISLERVRSATEIRRLMESKGFSRTEEYKQRAKNKRSVEFVGGQEADVYYLQADGSKSHVGTAEPGEPLSVDTHVGHRFEVQDGFGDVITVYVVSEKENQRVRIPAESPDL